jgi:hypothetical protein
MRKIILMPVSADGFIRDQSASSAGTRPTPSRTALSTSSLARWRHPDQTRHLRADGRSLAGTFSLRQPDVDCTPTGLPFVKVMETAIAAEVAG